MRVNYSRFIIFVIFCAFSFFDCLALVGLIDQATADRYVRKGEEFFEEDNYDSTLYYVQRAIPYYESENDFKRQAKCFNLISKCYLSQHNYKDAFLFSEKVIAMSHNLSLAKVEIGNAYLNLGRIHHIKSNVDSSIYFNKKAVIIFEKIPGRDSDLAFSYLRIGVGYSYKLDFEKCLSYYNMSLSISKRIYGDKSTSVAKIYNNMANLYVQMNQHELAEQYLFRALEIYINAKGDFREELIFIYHNLSESNASMGNSEMAINYLHEAELLMAGQPDNHDSIVVLRNMGILLHEAGKHDSSMVYLQRSLDLAKRFFGSKHPANSSILYAMGVVFANTGDNERSIEMIHESIMANTPSFNSDDVFLNPVVGAEDFSRFLSIRSLIYKGSVFRKAYDESSNIKYLKASLDAYMVTDSLLTNTRMARRAFTDKIQLGKFATVLYEGGINACLEMFNQTNNTDFEHLAFYFSEKAKSGVMMETLVDLSAKSDGEIPESLLNLEREIKEKRSFLQSKVLAGQQDIDAKKYEKELFYVNTKSDSLMSFFEETYPAYYELKYKSKIENVLSLQDEISPKTVVFEFFEGEDSVYLFAVSKMKYQIYHFSNDSIYSSAIEKLRSSLNQENIRQSAPDKYGDFVQSSSSLYSLLLEKTLIDFSSSTPIDELIIIPDGHLHSLPFDILITRKPTQEENDYRNLNYLIKNYVVNYGYSSTLSFDTPNRKATSNSYLGFAPEYISSVDSSQLQSLGKFRDEIMPLKWNQHEVVEVSNIVGGKYYLAGDATEELFKSEAHNSQIIHMAMHTLINDEDPMNSKFVFTLGNDSIEDGFLHAFELYNMQLNANLAVLSACNTGLGKLSRGEGVMSLARGFRYTGVPNLIMSLWQVSDLPTSELMILFYQELDKGVTYAEALRNAKLKYLESSDMVTSNPFYWGAFVFIGEPVSLPEKSVLWVWLIGGVLTTGILWSVVRYKRLLG